MSTTEDVAEQVAAMVRQQLRERMPRPEVTYRVQFHPEHFTFRDAAAIVPYLRDLGVSHVYASPYLMARAGSEHGYDLVDPGRLNPELGTADDFEHFVDVLHEHGLGQILDVVPNHMGIASSQNRWWYDILENGPSSPYAEYFDIDWRPVKPELRDKVLLPMLGDQYGLVLEAGQLQLQREGGAVLLEFYGMRLPVEPKSSSVLLSHRFAELKSRPGTDPEAVVELESILTALEHLPAYTATDADSVAERQREKEVIKGRLESLTSDCPEIGEFLDGNIREFNGDPEQPRSFDLLDDLLERQVYRLCHWKAASDEINYRRFFDINELAAVCMEEPDVFEKAHRFVFNLLARGAIDGLRIDHIDGLFDPDEYLWRLQWGYVRTLAHTAFQRREREHANGAESTLAAAAPGPATVGIHDTGGEEPEWESVEAVVVRFLHRDVGGPSADRLFPGLLAGGRDAEGMREAGLPHESLAWSRDRLPLYVVVEKILEANEDLPATWPAAGTTGYEFLNSAAGLFVDRGGVRELTKRYQRFTHQKQDLREVVYQCKRLIINVAMAAELQLLAVRISRLSEQHRRSRDFTLNDLRKALQEIIACFPVYRTYITGESADEVSERDRDYIAAAVRRARRRNPALDVRLFEFVQDVLLLKQPPELDSAELRARRFFVGRFQQVTSPVMAKGVEDTAFYRYFPLSSLNEVGGGFENVTSPADFHAENITRQTHRAGSLLCSTSHDTKRSEDVRARISVLSEIPDQWRAALSEWSRLNRRHRREVDRAPAPSRNDEYLFYQTLLGIWPVTGLDGSEREQLTGRIHDYMQKATHEAKLHTSWLNPNPEYDEAVSQFVRAALEDGAHNRFLTAFVEFHEHVIDHGLYAALSQLVLKLTAPGVPDIYQGQEIWDFSLVDPDNRRPVDYEYRRRLLFEIRRDFAGGTDAVLGLTRYLAGHPRDDRLKLFVTWRCLSFRRGHQRLFREGRCVPLTVEGSRSDHLVAFAWRHDPIDDFAVVVVPRLLAGLAPGGLHHGSPDCDPSEIWEDTSVRLDTIPEGSIVNLFNRQPVSVSNGSVSAADLFAGFPVAVVCRTESAERVDMPRP
jgi:(1->4)-alpha-D-glucan 1-alpha-D-glucosylmutase